jgi:flagellar protein FlaG
MINESVKNGYSSVSPVRENVPAVLPVTGPTSLAASDTVAESAKAQTPVPADMGKAVSKLNDHVQNLRRTLSFSIEESTGRTVIKVYDAETEELIRQIPPEETIRLAEVIEDQNASLFIEERA